MDLEQLVEMGLSEEQAKAVLAGLDGAYVTKSRFNEVNGAKKTLERTLQERDAQLREANGKLEAAGGEGSKAEAEQLRGEMATLKESFEAERKAWRLDAVADKQILDAKAKNPALVRALLKEEGFFEKAELEEDGGAVKGLAERLEAMGKEENTAFIFAAPGKEEKPGLTGLVPGERKEGAPPPAQPTTLQEAVEMALQASQPQT